MIQSIIALGILFSLIFVGTGIKVRVSETEKIEEKVFEFHWKELADDDWIASPLIEKSGPRFYATRRSSWFIFVATNTEDYIQVQKSEVDEYTKQMEAQYKRLKPFREKWCQDFLENKVEKPQNYTVIWTANYCIEILGL